MCAPDKILDSGSKDCGLIATSTTTPAGEGASTRIIKQQQEDEAEPLFFLTRATRLGAASIGFLTMATTLTMPYFQSLRDELGCDSICQGNMASARSTLSLIGAAFVGRISDWEGHNDHYNNNNAGNNHDAGSHKKSKSMRHVCLLMGLGATALSLILTNRAKAISDLWLSLVPNLLQQNLSVMKALLSDYHLAHEQRQQQQAQQQNITNNNISAVSAKTDRASSAGALGMAGGLALMLGPVLGSSLLTTFDQATAFSMALLLLSAMLIFVLPCPIITNQNYHVKTKSYNNKDDKDAMNKQITTGKKNWLLLLLDVPSARSPAALFVLFNRLLSALSFHIFSVISLPSLKQRFEFGPKQYGIFFSVVGLFFALSQGVVSPWALRTFGGNTSKGRSRLLVFCTLITCVGRYLAFYTNNILLVYVFNACLITAVGIVSTIMGADMSQIAAPNEVGSFFGILAAVESGAGMLGPLMGSVLASSSAVYSTAVAPLFAVIGLHLLAAVLIQWGYDRFVFQHIAGLKNKNLTAHEKQE